MMQNEALKKTMLLNKEKLTKEEAVRRHRELWNKIAELCTSKDIGMGTCDSIKYIALKSLGYDDPLCAPTNRCWACYYCQMKDYEIIDNEDAERRKSWINCHNCLFDWYHHDEPWDAEWSNYCDNGTTLYSRFRNLILVNGDWKEAARIAREIANMPVREDV